MRLLGGDHVNHICYLKEKTEVQKELYIVCLIYSLEFSKKTGHISVTKLISK